MKTERLPGYYWVKYDGEWMIGLIEKRKWALHLAEEFFEESDFEEIDERRIERESEPVAHFSL